MTANQRGVGQLTCFSNSGMRWCCEKRKRRRVPDSGFLLVQADR